MNVNNNFRITRDKYSSDKNINNENIKTEFKDVLTNEIIKSNEIQFSKHANQRLNTRNINLTNEQMKRVNKGIESAKNKKVNEALVLVDDIALVVSVKNNIIVTIMNKEQNNIFTNIDGAIIV